MAETELWCNRNWLAWVFFSFLFASLQIFQSLILLTPFSLFNQSPIPAKSVFQPSLELHHYTPPPGLQATIFSHPGHSSLPTGLSCDVHCPSDLSHPLPAARVTLCSNHCALPAAQPGTTALSPGLLDGSLFLPLAEFYLVPGSFQTLSPLPGALGFLPLSTLAVPRLLSRAPRVSHLVALTTGHCDKVSVTCFPCSMAESLQTRRALACPPVPPATCPALMGN